MIGADIPLNTIYTIHTDGRTTKEKKPLYTLKSAEEVKAHQEKLGENAGWYYGTWCKKCCGVYPAFYNELNFNNFGYDVCLVCGKESLHEPMPWQCRDDWNAGRYIWEPSGSEYYQMSLEDWISER